MFFFVQFYPAWTERKIVVKKMNKKLCKKCNKFAWFLLVFFIWLFFYITSFCSFSRSHSLLCLRAKRYSFDILNIFHFYVTNVCILLVLLLFLCSYNRFCLFHCKWMICTSSSASALRLISDGNLETEIWWKLKRLNLIT